MKNFRIYVNECGWELLTIKHDLYETKREVGRLVNKDKRIMVIMHDTDLNQDEVITKDELFKMKTLGTP